MDDRIVASQEEILAGLLPPVRGWESGGEAYNPAHCLAIYRDTDERENPNLDFPALLLLHSAFAPLHIGCSLLAGIPEYPPSGSLILGTARRLRKYPALAPLLRRPLASDEYLLSLGRYAVLAGGSRNACVAGAHTLIQILALAEGRLVPGMTIYDEPQIPLRGLLYDGRKSVMGTDTILRLGGAIAAFKGNRLHLRLDSEIPISAKARRGSIVAEEAEEGGVACREYGISLVAWIDLLPRLASREIAPREAIPLLAQTARFLHAQGIGLSGAGDAIDLRPLRETIEGLRNEGIREILLPWELAQRLRREDEQGIRVWHEASSAIPGGEGEDPVPWTLCLSAPRRRGRRSLIDFLQAAEKMIATRRKNMEIVFASPRLLDGEALGADLDLAAITLGMGWNRAIAGEEMAKRFPRLVGERNSKGKR